MVNVYDAMSPAAQSGAPIVAPAKALMGLTTRVDVVRFNHDGSALATASMMEKDAMRVVRLGWFSASGVSAR